MHCSTMSGIPGCRALLRQVPLSPKLSSRLASKSVFKTVRQPQLRFYSTPISALKVNQARLMDDLHYTCRFGTGERWGE